MEWVSVFLNLRPNWKLFYQAVYTHLVSVPSNQHLCVFQWGQNKSQVWHRRCSLPVLPASSDHPAVGHMCRLPLSRTTRQPDRRPAGWVLRCSLSFKQKAIGDLTALRWPQSGFAEVYSDTWCLLTTSFLLNQLLKFAVPQLLGAEPL